MLNYVKTILKLWLILSCGVTYASPPEWCVRIFVNEKDCRDGESFEPESMGSGTLISTTLVATNWHVVRDRKNDTAIQVMFPDWTLAENPEVITQNIMWDLAIIRIKTTKKTPVTLGEDPKVNRYGKPKVMATIRGYGYGVYAESSGYMKSGQAPDKKFFGTEEADDLLLIKGAGARRGDSGGAVTDGKGQYIGILNASNGCDTYFIVQSQIQKLLEEKGINLENTYENITP